MTDTELKRYFEDFEVGDTNTAPGRTITETDVTRFSGIEGVYARAHANKAYMSETEYGDILPHGVLLLAIADGMTTRFPGWYPDLLALYGFDRVRFPNPAGLGDTVHAEVEVTNKEPRGGEHGLITWHIELLTEDGDPVMVADWRLVFNRAP